MGLIFCLGYGEPEMWAKLHVSTFFDFQRHWMLGQRSDIDLKCDKNLQRHC